MSLQRFLISNLILKPNPTYCVLNQNKLLFTAFKQNSPKIRYGSTAINLNFQKDNKTSSEDKRKQLHQLIEKYEDKILYSCVTESQRLKLGYKKNVGKIQKIERKQRELDLKLQAIEPLPVTLKYFNTNIAQKNNKSDNENQNLKDSSIKNEDRISEIQNNITQSGNFDNQNTDHIDKLYNENSQITQFPFESSDKIITNDENLHIRMEIDVPEAKTLENEVLARHKDYDEVQHKNWMTDYENYDDVEEETEKPWQLNYGTPNPKSAVSNVPCGGCGALLHCKDTSIPGYIPSEIFSNHKSRSGQHLKSMICQRCHFLKYYDMALQVRVSPEDYPKTLMKIKANPNALAILMVDLLDFPCSIWPNIIDIIGHKRPVIVVGNKVDLLPQDSRGYLKRIEKELAESVNKSGLSRANIKNVSLISAKTGYGVEELITMLHSIWEYKGDVYLLGCTNVGKSTLFNALLQSDFCKVQAVDLVQRATTSPWPGTTLNLLKFPILKPSGWRLFVRNKRLISLQRIRNQEEQLRKIQLRKTNNPKYAMLIGQIERTFSSEEPVAESKDIFSVTGQVNASGKVRMGINENDTIYKLSKWCYDTPGVVHPAQILHLLTAEELMLTLPKQLIQPRIFSMKPGQTLFIAGLGRLDLLSGPVSLRFTVFASDLLPVTICKTCDAAELYEELVGTDMLKVPCGSSERLDQWPDLEAGEDIKLKGIDWEISCADVVLSSAGWVSVSCGHNVECTLRAWTPEKKGIYVRNSILPNIVGLRGRRIRFSPAYRRTKFYIQQ